MNTQQVKEAKARAEEVVNGFKRVTDRNARDALKLAEAVEERDKRIAALEQKAAADAFSGIGKNPKDNIFSDIFGGR